MKNKKENDFMSILIWIVSTIISLVIGSGMINKTLIIPIIPSIIMIILGWVVTISAILILIMAIFNK